ncbi:MAG: sulfatase-like hydrolase/transferase [Candidatus Latescibacteria bacterium]|nr:sulfatase-like hydrolase/transferase [Candidatus Latescibacterota bacterium]
MSQRPNILFIVSDQMVAALTGAYGHPVVQTPHLNRLAAEGVRFDSAYTPFPLCSPGRACFMTGRHASNIGAWDNGALLKADQPTFAHYLSEAGYDAVLSGKMHFVGPEQQHGFRQRLTTDIYSSDFTWVKPEWIAIKEAKGENCEAVMADRSSYNAGGYTGDGVQINNWHNALSYDEETHFRALEYLRAQGRRQGDPFLLCASYHHPHEPFHPPQEYWDMYEGADIAIPEFPANLDDTYSLLDQNLNAYHGTRRFNLRDPDGLYRLRRAYYGLVTYMDRKVGELLDALDETGQADNTVVVFASDHGDMLCEKEMVQKRCFYEWSARVPLIARFPDKWKAGAICNTPVNLIDLLPTFCELANAPTALPYDGDSLLGIIDGNDADRPTFVQAHEAVGVPCIMVRQGPYKYNYIHGHAAQLFNLDEDPGEWKNLCGNPAHAKMEQALRKLVLDQFDPDIMASENLESLHRRRLIRDVMVDQGRTWCHFPQFNYRKGASDQYLG